MDQNLLRVGVFLLVLFSCMVLEALYPRKQRQQPRSQRWLTNLLMVVIGSLTVRLMGAVTAVAVALWAQEQGWGLFNWLQWPFWLEVLLAFLLLDFAIYGQHVASHHIPLLWRLHRVHHADRDIDVTTGNRFHPLEIAFSMLFKCAVVLLLGPAVLAVVLFEIVLNASAMFNHANLRLPIWLDTRLRKLVVTPDFHRVHHSAIARETNSNYGFFLSIWDRLCGTYTAQPKEGHDKMTIGLEEYQTSQPANLLWCLLLPFKK